MVQNDVAVFPRVVKKYSEVAGFFIIIQLRLQSDSNQDLLYFIDWEKMEFIEW